MAGIAKKSFDAPDEHRSPDKTEVQVVDLGSVNGAQMTLQPGCRWSDCIKPYAFDSTAAETYARTQTASLLVRGETAERGNPWEYTVNESCHASSTSLAA
jgi:hypothetical protein